ncbi:class I adenylate-forming enzyme family protein [Blastococcus sp. Marseille-P5729]|uniref:class I adenylate-forming enzyme family protein n=1 Tax=Blastococcus sp. Marseille-P5729 TaxID=2086582 RepID=UPI000D0FE1F9|nr:class I adenylate-forming enzyme family protein [Blastococcus sp. Marseille-P5729]
MTYGELLTQRAREAGDKVFLRADSLRGEMTAVTYAEMDQRSRQIAAGLQALGVQKGDRIAIAAPNTVEWLELFFGAVRAGMVVVTLNVRYRESELEYMIGQSQAKVVVSSARLGDFDYEQLYHGLAQQLPSVEHYLFIGTSTGGRRFEDLYGDAADVADPGVQPDDPAVILYTSGTTGRPKGAILTHRSMISSGSAQREHTGFGPDNVQVSCMPLNHVGGITCAVTTCLVGGGELVMLPAFAPEPALQAIANYGGTNFGGVPTMWKLMIDHPSFASYDVSSLQEAVIGGSNAEPTLCRQIVEAFPNTKLTNLYGLSESSGAAVLSAHDDTLEEVSRYIGVTIPGVEARVVDLAGTPLGADEEGELQLRGDGVAAGYWEMPEESRSTFLDDGWLSTGDMATITADGHIALKGRLKEMYVQGGYNVYPVEVENLLTSHPAVAMAAGIGIADPVLGEVGRYFVLKQGEVTGDELVEFCRGKLADYKVPREIVFVDELPMTPAGKIAKAQLRAQ